MLLTVWLHRFRRPSRTKSRRHRLTLRHFAVETLEDRSLLATFLVDTLVDESDGDFSSGDLSLREAIERANSISGADTILFDAALNGGTISLGGTALRIDDSVDVVGPGSELLEINGNRASGVLLIHFDGTVNISGLTIADGLASSGAGISNSTNLTLSGVAVLNNEVAFNNNGGGIYHSGSFSSTLTLIDSRIANNIAAGSGSLSGGEGGGIFNQSVMRIVNSVIESNTSKRGGGVFSHDMIEIEDSIFRGNESFLEGGAVGIGQGMASISNTDFVDNVADSGGAIFTRDGTVTVATSTFDSNTADLNGGAIFIDSRSSFTLLNSRITGSSASTGGAIRNRSVLLIEATTISGNHASGIGANGGGLYNEHPATIINSTISGNTSNSRGGGIASYRELTLINSTISGNFATEDGGGLYLTNSITNYDATGLIRNSTIALNWADSDNNGTGQGGGIFVDAAAVPASASLNVELNNTIVAGNDDTPNPSDIIGTVTGAHNLIGNAATAGGLIDGNDGNIVGSNGSGTFPIMFILNTTLADNGGPTLTHALVVGSPALDSGDNSLAIDAAGNPLSFDQRGPGFIRVLGAVVDNGAFEGIASPTNVVYVNDDFTQPDGTVIADADPNTNGDQPAMIGVNAFDMIQEGVDAVEGGGTVMITDRFVLDGPGFYAENILIDKNVIVSATGGKRGSGETPAVVDGGAIASVISMSPNVMVTLHNLTIQNGDAANGGGIFNDGGMLTLDSSIIQNNTAQNGSGLYNTGSVLLLDSQLTNNSATALGGGFFNAVSGDVVVDSTVLGWNMASESGGGIWNSESGQLTIRNGSTLVGNTVSGSAAGQGGGGLFNDRGIVDIDGSSAAVEIRSNHADGALGSGGGILTHGGSVAIEASEVRSNSAVRAGGGIEVAGRATLTIVNGQISSNHATPLSPTQAAAGHGGAIHVTGAGNMVTVSGGDLRFNRAEAGGAFWNDAGSTLRIDQAAGNILVVLNQAIGDEGGGAIFNNGGTLILDGAARPAQLRGISVSSNSALGAFGRGGGIRSVDGDVTIIRVYMGENSATDTGGGIDIQGGSLTVMDTHFDVNEATGAGDAAGNGGGVHISGPEGTTATLSDVVLGLNVAGGSGGGLWNDIEELTISGTHLVANTAHVDGGGIFNSSTGNVTISNSEIRGNRASSLDGGGVLNDGGQFLIHDSIITDNHAARFGGGFENRGGNLVIDTNETNFNTAGVNGGGVHVTGMARTVVDRGTVWNNTAGEEGGGLWNSAQGVMIVFDGADIAENVASGDGPDQGGGGIFNDGSGGTGGRLAISLGAIISRNAADGAAGSGGGILSIDGVVTLDEARVLDNTANRAGGGIEFVSGIVELNNSHVDTNRALGGGAGAAGNGGGLHVTGRIGQVGFIRVIGGSVSGNSAAGAGGGLRNHAGNIMVLRGGVVIDGNTASGDAADEGGGGIFNNSGRLAIIEGAVISNNVADGTSGSGGGLFSMGSGVSIEGGTTISGNAANRAGGGLEVVNGLMTILDSTISGNTAGITGTANPGSGGGVHVTGTNFTRVDLRASVVSGNSAASEGGGLWNQTNGVMLVREGTRVNGNVASGDAADQGGGGIFNNAGGRLAIAGAAEISNNTAGGLAGSGGGIYSAAGGVSLEGNSLVSGNSANRAGGGIEIVDGVLTIVDSTLEGNHATGGGLGPGNGGGVHVSGTDFTRFDLRNSTVTGNTAASKGGGLLNQTNGVMLIRTGTQVTGNVAEGDAADEGGGGAFNNGGRLVIHAATIDGNTANGTAGRGGGLFSASGVVTVENATISGNTANRAGGGIEIVDGILITRNMDLTGNNAGGAAPNPGNGGGLHVSGTNLTRVTIAGGTISGNRAARQGGGVWHQTGSILVIAEQARVRANLAGSGNAADGGAGFFNNGGRLAITNIELSNNDATGRGGGILSLGGGVSVDNSTVAHNDATGDGGGIFSNGDLFMHNSTIVQNLADADDVGGGTGGGIFNGGTATLRNTIVSNVAGTALIPSDIAGNNLSSGSRNTLISHAGSAGGLVDGVGGHIIGINGTGTRPISSVLEPIGDNGGANGILTYALVHDSVAIDAGDNFFAKDTSGNVLTTDQRGFGFSRIKNGTVDIGAFER